jgi:ParB family chromosome partitioning protein
MGLGKGLDALFQDNSEEDGSVITLKLTQMEPNKSQPRANCDPESLRELADSIRSHGVLQPVVVRPLETGGYQIVAGERRWRAARMAGLTEIPVIIKELTDAQTLEIAIIENLQREDLNAVELAQGYKALMEQHGLTQEQVAEKLGKSRPVVANTIRLLSLPPGALGYTRSGEISAGHAKALLSLEDSALIEEVAAQAAKGKLLVRDIERMAKTRKAAPKDIKEKPADPPAKDPLWGDNYYKEMAIALSTELGRKVRITEQGKKAVLEMEFYSPSELADIAARLTRSHW